MNNILFSPIKLLGLGFTGIFCIVLPIALFVIWRRKTGAALLPPAAGAALYLLVSILRAVIRSGFSQDNASSFYFAQALLSGALEETARFIAFRFLLHMYDSRGDAVSYGIGHGFYEIFSAGMLYLGYLYTGLTYRSSGIEGLTAGLSPEESARMLEYAQYVASVNPMFQLIGSLSAAAFHIAMSVIVFYGVRSEKSGTVLPSAIAAHTLINYLRAVSPFWVEITLTVLSAAVLSYIAYRLYNEMSY